MRALVDEGWVNVVGGAAARRRLTSSGFSELARSSARVPVAGEPQAVSGIEVLYPADDNRPISSASGRTSSARAASRS